MSWWHQQHQRHSRFADSPGVASDEKMMMERSRRQSRGEHHHRRRACEHFGVASLRQVCSF